MSTNDSPNRFASAIAELRDLILQAEQAIQLLERLGGKGIAPDIIVSGPASATKTPLQQPAGDFSGLTIIAATMKLLRTEKRPLGNAEIATALKAGGLMINSADTINTIGAVIARRHKAVGDIVRVSRGVWGLREWNEASLTDSGSLDPA